MCLPYSVTPSNYAYCDGWQGLIRRSTPGNGDGQWPKPRRSGCSQPAAVALNLITAGQRDADVLVTSCCTCGRLTPEGRHITWLVT